MVSKDFNNLVEQQLARIRSVLIKKADEYNLEYIFVLTMALTLGENEDFDGLVMSCEDAQKLFEEGE